MSLQATFRHALLDPGAPVPEDLRDGHGGPAGRRFSVYRNNVAVSLTEALRTAFPVLRKLLGPGTFDRLAGLYLRAHPPRSPLMMFYGADMPGFLETFAPLRHVGYLPDVARLENALRHSYHAADAAPLAADALGDLGAEKLAGARLRLAPAVGLVASNWPLFDIWRFNSEDAAPKPRAIAQPVLVTRPDYDPRPHPLSSAEALFLAAVMEGRPLSQAVELADADLPDFDPGLLLARLVADHAITDLKT